MSLHFKIVYIFLTLTMNCFYIYFLCLSEFYVIFVALRGKNRWLSSAKTHDIHQLVSELESSVENRKKTTKCGWNPGFVYRRAKKLQNFGDI